MMGMAASFGISVLGLKRKEPCQSRQFAYQKMSRVAEKRIVANAKKAENSQEWEEMRPISANSD